jgi:hypothetical protein
MKFGGHPLLVVCLALTGTVLGACSAPSARTSANRLPASGATAPLGGAQTELVRATSLVGLTADEVRNRLGAPDVQRRENAAQLWQYADSGCVLLVFLYGGSAAGEQVAHVDEVATPKGHNCMEQFSSRTSRSAALTY